MTTDTAPPDMADVNALAALIRRVDGSHTLGATALAEALIDAGVRAPIDANTTEQTDPNAHHYREYAVSRALDAVETTADRPPVNITPAIQAGADALVRLRTQAPSLAELDTDEQRPWLDDAETVLRAAGYDHMAERLAGKTIELRDAMNDLGDIRGILSPQGQIGVGVPMELGDQVAPAVEWLRDERRKLAEQRDEARAELDRLRTVLAEERNSRVHDRARTVADVLTTASRRLSALAAEYRAKGTRISQHQADALDHGATKLHKMSQG